MSLTITQGIIFVAYITFILFKFGVLSSISESWYRLKDLKGVWYSLFTWFCFGLGILMFFQTDGSTALFFVSGAGLTGVGVATLFKANKSIEPYIHYGGAFLGIFGSLVGIGLERHSFIPLLTFAICIPLIYLFKVKNSTWWLEVCAFIIILAGLVIY